MTVRLPSGLLRRLKEESAAGGVSMNAYLERVLAKALSGNRNSAQRIAAARLLMRAKDGLYEMDRPLTREEAHERHA
ncbi:MAG: toxin-antitoxin system HicB family antitoxin [Bryobacteraceae bacterium]